jgi:hypothetical protein
LSTKDWLPGIYLVKVSLPEGEKSYKIIKQ